MLVPREAAYGTWKSPITTEMLAAQDIEFDDVQVDAVTSEIFHVEKRPKEKNRFALVKTEDNFDVLGKEWSIITSVYGHGEPAWVVQSGSLIFSNAGDRRVYKAHINVNATEPTPITPDNTNHRFADFAIHPTQSHLIVAVMEDATKPAKTDVIHSLVFIDSSTCSTSFLVSGADFYSSPTFSPDGTRIAWVQWSHPDMPWDGGEVHIGDVEIKDGRLRVHYPRKVAGEHMKSSAVQPSWVNSSTLLFTHDISGYRNLYITEVNHSSKVELKVELATSANIEEDFGHIQWNEYAYAILDSQHAVCNAYRNGRSILYLVNLIERTWRQLESPYVKISHVRRRSDKSIVFFASTVDEPLAVVLCSINMDMRSASYSSLKSSSTQDKQLLRGMISAPQPILLVTSANNEPIHVVHYPPLNAGYIGLTGTKPPAILSCHGGPTGLPSQGLDMTVQYFTSLGWAFIDVCYAGSACYGRKYLERLVGRWGTADVKDCIETAVQLSSSPYNLIDKNRIVIRGGSAGGFLAFNCLWNAPEIFRAAVPAFGLCDLKRLSEFTPKLLSHYVAHLVGGRYEDIPEVYEALSPVNNADKIKAPLLILQGADDFIIPASQAEALVEKIRKRNGRVEYISFEGEGHGWSNAETIKEAFEKELGFLMDVLDLKEAEE